MGSDGTAQDRRQRTGYKSSSTISSLLWTIHVYCSRCLRGSAGCHEQPIDFGHIEGRAGTLARLNTLKAFVRSIGRINDVDNSFSATYVNPLPSCIYEHVIGITACVDACND